MKNYSEIVEVGPAEELVLGGGPKNALDVPIDFQEYRPNDSVVDADIVEVGPAEELVLGGGPKNALDVPIDTQEFRPDDSIVDAD